MHKFTIHKAPFYSALNAMRSKNTQPVQSKNAGPYNAELNGNDGMWPFATKQARGMRIENFALH